MKVLVTGGAGFIGSHIVDLLIKQGFDVVIVDNLSTGSLDNIQKNTKFYNCDLSSPRLETIFKLEKPLYVIHQAAQVDVSKSVNDPLLDAENNILATINLLNNCKKFNVNKIIYASSCAVYGDTDDISIPEEHPINPLSFYGASKYTAEEYIRLFHKLFGLRFTILRYANVFGPRQTSKGEGGVVAIFFDQLINNKQPAIFGNGEQTRDFIYVKDVARANVLALTNGDNNVFNISRNEKTSINNLYKMMQSIAKIDKEPLYMPQRPGDILYSRLNNIKADKLLKWKSKLNLKDQLKETFEYYKEKK
ncbi:NAD-dependent epimerase/dehydratase family protein [Metabacillus fastidiosus]|uniref:NAD-dependent epimerase/dehydratase family protein n=1 Tax=Metabacillus fastidiosus TaxID=1458 RepID=UPI002E1C9196|nr:NAD-dependent epimerase/dehydratase family protein [Metabacillus fastidiosus]MED4533612.1 NAD-dependent epimerase/dehydratase family protein [Metabacillus fastidiosus]